MSEGIMLEKTDKSGNIDSFVISDLSEMLLQNKCVILPVDGIYGTAALLNSENHKKFKEQGLNSVYVMVKCFTDLEKYSRLEKCDYDFLHRLWPDDVYVKLDSDLEGAYQTDFYFYMPKTVFLLNLLKRVNAPIMFSFKNSDNKKPFYKVEDIKKNYSTVADSMLIINQYCKEHLIPTFIDIRDRKIQIVKQGRVDIEDIKSLYYL